MKKSAQRFALGRRGAVILLRNKKLVVGALCPSAPEPFAIQGKHISRRMFAVDDD